MRKLVLTTAIVLMSASAHAQTIDVGSILSANGISLGNAGGQQMGGMGQGGSNMQAGTGGQGAAAQGQSQQGQSQQGQSQQSQSRHRQSARRGKHGQPHESAQETRARNIAAKYGISW